MVRIIIPAVIKKKKNNLQKFLLVHRSISNIHLRVHPLTLRRSKKLNLKPNSNPSCNFLSRVGSSRSYPRETKAFRFAVGRDKP